jgi:hypothetical protein
MQRDADALNLFANAISGEKSKLTGILLHRRFPNFPIQLIPNLYDNLYEDVQWIRAQSDRSGEEQVVAQELKAMQQFILLSTCSTIEAMIAEGHVIRADRSILYDDFEDEIFIQHSDIAVIYRPKHSKSLLCASIISWRSMKEILAAVKDMCASTS